MRVSLLFICLKYVNKHNLIACVLWNLVFFICPLGSLFLHLLVLELLPLGRVASFAVGVAGVVHPLVPFLVEGPIHVLPEVLCLGLMELEGGLGSLEDVLPRAVLLERALEVRALRAPDVDVLLARLDLWDRSLSSLARDSDSSMIWSSTNFWILLLHTCGRG